MTRGTLPVVEPPFPDRERRAATVRGVVLAAGTSSRYGDRNKLLEPIDGEPLVRRAVASLLGAPLAGVTVVLGHEHERVRTALAECDVEFRYNGDYARGQSGSLRTGVEAVRAAGADAAVFALGDMPAVSRRTIETLVEAHRVTGRSALAAGHDGRRGNPVLLDAVHFDALARVSGDVGGRDVLRAAPDAAVVETGDPGVLRDVDRPGDLEGGEEPSGRE